MAMVMHVIDGDDNGYVRSMIDIEGLNKYIVGMMNWLLEIHRITVTITMT